MPTFLKDLRRISRSSFRTEKSADQSSGSDESNTNQSSSTVNTGLGTPPNGSFHPSQQKRPDTANDSAPSVLRRPSVNPIPNNRYSIANGSQLTLSSTIPSRQQHSPTSPYAPRILSVSDNSWVNQKVLLVFGEIGNPSQQPVDGQMWVCHHQDTFPATPWPVSDSYFKALVHLQPGPNRLRFDFVSPRVPTANGNPAHSSWFTINYLPLNGSPPLELAIVLGKDSPGTFDAVPERKEREGNGLETAIKKFKMAAYLWQAFTGEQMNRNGFGRRCFRFDEEWQPSTLSARDAASGQMRNEAKVHIVRSDLTVAQLRDPELAQQNHNGSRNGDLFGIAGDAVKRHLNFQPGQKRYVAILLLDTHWDTNLKLVTAHAALGGGGDGFQHAIFGSHALQSYPSCIEEVVPAFTDCTRTDTSYVANDLEESGSNWEAANIGIGAHMHEVGHLFGCPHQTDGVMARGYVTLNRTFVCKEAFSTRTKSPGKRLCLPEDECAWHRLDILRFRFHPCFALPSDGPLSSDASAQAWSVESGNVVVTAGSGIAWIEVRAEGDDTCQAHLEYLDKSSFSRPPPSQITLTESGLREILPSKFAKTKKLSLEIFTTGGGKLEVQDFTSMSSKDSKIKLPTGRMAFRGAKLGFSQLEGSQAEQVLFQNSGDRCKIMTSIKIYHGYALDGIEFFYEDKTSQLMGKRGGTPGGSEFALDTRRGETVYGFYLRAGLWIDGVQIITSLGRRSDIFGNPSGGSGHTLLPPRGYTIAGISGSSGAWMDGFSMLITR